MQRFEGILQTHQMVGGNAHLNKKPKRLERDETKHLFLACTTTVTAGLFAKGMQKLTRAQMIHTLHTKAVQMITQPLMQEGGSDNSNTEGPERGLTQLLFLLAVLIKRLQACPFS